MGQSHVRRRWHERTLRSHRRAVVSELREVCDRLNLDPAPEQRGELLDEVVWLANPWAFSGIDAVLPADRRDLIRLWFTLRLVGAVETRSQIERMARSLAPMPDDDFCPGMRGWGDPTSADVAAAYRSRQRRRARRR